ncbi:hypothetical protein IAD21_05331 [Abditibacteriota bacterium]|nr:hypothetical protein IAD21_05331 [Abditibacteriota bacterium]
MQIFALIYAPLFLLMASRRPTWALFSIFALAPLQMNVGGGGLSFSIAEVNLLLTSIVWVLRLRHSRYGLSLGPLTQPIVGYLLVCALGSMVAWRGSDAVLSFIQMLLYIVVTVLLFATMVPVDELRLVPYSLLPVAVVWSLIGIKTHFFFMSLEKNAFGGTLAPAFLVALDLWLAKGYLRRPFKKDWGRHAVFGALVIIAMGLVLSLSRGAWIGTLGGLFMLTMMRRASVKMAKIAILIFPLLIVLWHSLPQNEKEYTFGFGTNRMNIRLRYRSIKLAQDNFLSNPFLGTGVGFRKNYDATNVVLSTLGESGIVGFLAFAWIYVVFYRLCWRSRKILHPSDPRFSLLSLGCALMTCKILHGMVDQYWGRGSITLAWGAAGMTLAYCRIPLEARARQMYEARLRRFGGSITMPTALPSSSPTPVPQAVTAMPFSSDGARS